MAFLQFIRNTANVKYAYKYAIIEKMFKDFGSAHIIIKYIYFQGHL